MPVEYRPEPNQLSHYTITMPIKLTLLGLGRLGGSLALRLNANPDLTLNGYDGEPETAQQAVRQGLLKRADWNLRRAVEGADLVLADLPYTELPHVLAAIAPDVRTGCVVAALGPLLGPPLDWADKLDYFVAVHPALNPAHLHTGEMGLAAARADLFERGLWAMAPAANCPPEALKLVADVARLTGATAYHIDPAEHDGLAAASGGLPVLFACALLSAASASPGWDETRKIADRALATATAALADADPAALARNRDNLLRYLDLAQAELTALRGLLAAGSPDAAQDALAAALAEAATLRNAWRYDRQQAVWDLPDTPTSAVLPATGEMIGQMLLGKWGRPRK